MGKSTSPLARIVVLAALIAAGWALGMYAGHQSHPGARASLGTIIGLGRADDAADPGPVRPGPTNPGPAF